MTKMQECLLRPGQMIAFDGDSLTSRRLPGSLDTWPFLELMNWRITYADEIKRLLFCLRPDLRLNFRNVAIGGSSSRDLLARLDQSVLPLKPGWVILTCGGNDVARGIKPAEFRRNMSEYARRVREECSGRLALVGGFKACPGMPQAKGKTYSKRLAYYRVLQQVAAQYDGVYVDAGTPLLVKARELFRQSDAHTIYSDGGHFNAVGSLIVAGAVLGALGVSLTT